MCTDQEDDLSADWKAIQAMAHEATEAKEPGEIFSVAGLLHHPEHVYYVEGRHEDLVILKAHVHGVLLTKGHTYYIYEWVDVVYASPGTRILIDGGKARRLANVFHEKLEDAFDAFNDRLDEYAKWLRLDAKILRERMIELEQQAEEDEARARDVLHRKVPVVRQ